MIYLPIKLEDSDIVFIKDKDTIRVIKSNNTYTDYYINSHYISKNGVLTDTIETTVSLDHDIFTTDFYYRNDLDSILICFSILSFFFFVIPFMLLKRFARWF